MLESRREFSAYEGNTKYNCISGRHKEHTKSQFANLIQTKSRAVSGKIRMVESYKNVGPCH